MEVPHGARDHRPVWGLLTATRLLRGEEDAGRWELLLAGRTTRRGAGAQALAGLASGGLAMLAVTGALVVVVGRSPKLGFPAAGALLLLACRGRGALMFLAVGACARRWRHLAPGAVYAAAVLARATRCAWSQTPATGLGWLRWLTPLGWVEELQPLTSPRTLALIPVAGFMVMIAASSIYLAGAP